MTKVDSITKRWIRNASDERAVRDGCRFDEQRGRHPIEFAEQFLKLYEGDYAGEPLVPRDWQVEATQRLFGWVKWSEKWGRWVRRFKRATIWVPKKNKKSPTLAWWALYLLIADGEMGQKVFLAAKDGKQAKSIAGAHVINMLQQSPELLPECDINNGECSVFHRPTMSKLEPLSSAQGPQQKAKEGLNGSILVDELHVVDENFWRRISRAGISRSEPLILGVSTAGLDADCLGKKQFDYGRSVESGEFPDEEMLFIGYFAPQELTNEELDADPEKYGRLANPAWGHTIDPDEFIADYNRSKRNVAELADFKTYRLNIWQTAAAPWLDAGDWQACRRPIDWGRFRGKPCWGGLDLSRTRDMSALVLCFRDEQDADRFYLRPYFWLPEHTARQNNHLASYVQWEDDGHLDYCRGKTIDQDDIRAKVQQLNEEFNIQGIFYDLTYAHELAKALDEEDGVPMLEFKQRIMEYAFPTAEFERLVIAGRLHHDGHPILTWQAGHVKVKTDPNNNKRPIKPDSNDFKKIDGIIAGVMALALAKAQPEPPSYEMIVI